MFTVQSLVALTILSLMTTNASATNGTEGWTSTASPSPSASLSDPSFRPSPSSLPDSCPPDITDAEAYKTEHPNCARLAAKNKKNLQRLKCASVLGRPMNVTLHWDRDPSRAASALLAAVLRHVVGFQRVHLAPQSMRLAQFHQPDELVISLAAGLQDEAQAMADANERFLAYDLSHVRSRRRLHAWLTPAARLHSACQSANWTLYFDLRARARCGFSFNLSTDTVEVLGVGDDSRATMQGLLQRAEAAGSLARATFANRTVFESKILTSEYSFLFLDFDFWDGEPNVRVVEPPPCISDRHGVCQSELDDFTGMLVTDRKIHDVNQLLKLVQHFKTPPEYLRLLLKREANGENLEDAACGLAWNNTIYVPEEVFQNKTFVATYLCIGDSNIRSYDTTIKFAAKQIFEESPLLLKILFVRYYVNCSDSDHMARRLDDLMKGPRGLNMLGVVSLSVEGAAAASARAAEHRVPLLLAAPAPDGLARGFSTWRAAPRLLHVTLALHHFVAESGWTRVAVLSQPTTFARHYFAAFQDKAKFFLRNFEIPLGLTEQLAVETLQVLKATDTRVVLVNTDSDAAALILATAVKLHMSYVDGFIWILREPQTRPECSTTYFTVSFSNQAIDGIPKSQLQMLGADEVRHLVPPHSVALVNALMTLTRGFNNIFHQHPDVLTDLHSDRVIRAFDESLKETPVAGFKGVQLHYKERAIEEAHIYVAKWCGLLQNQLLATWRVNATSGSVRDTNSSQATLPLEFSRTRDPHSESSECGVRSNADGGSGGADGGTGQPANTPNPVFIVRQYIESTISKLKNPKSSVSVSDILNINKFNNLYNNLIPALN